MGSTCASCHGTGDFINPIASAPWYEPLPLLVGGVVWSGPRQAYRLPCIQYLIIIELHLSEAIVQVHSQSLFNSSEDAMSKKIKLQDLSISNFEQRIDVEGIKGGGSYFSINMEELRRRAPHHYCLFTISGCQRRWSW